MHETLPVDASTMQALFNVAVTFGGALFGWFVRIVWDANKELRQEVSAWKSEMDKRHSDFQTDVRTNFQRRDDFQRTADAIFAKLDRIENKLDGKVDKPRTNFALQLQHLPFQPPGLSAY